MSYCRWSCDDFGCDLYVYGSVNGYVIHVANNKVVGDVPKHTLIPEGDVPVESWFDAWFESHDRQMKWMDTAGRERIGLPHDGETFTLDTPQECIDKMLELREMGYRFPDYALSSLEEDIEVWEDE